MSFNQCGPMIKDDDDKRITWYGCCDGLGRFHGFYAHIRFNKGTDGFETQDEAAAAIDASRNRIKNRITKGSDEWSLGVTLAARLCVTSMKKGQ